MEFYNNVCNISRVFLLHMIMLIMKSRIQYINDKISCFKTRNLDGEYKRNENDACFSRKKQTNSPRRR